MAQGDEPRLIKDMEDMEERLLALAETVKTCIEAGTEINLDTLLDGMHEADIAELLNYLDPDEVNVVIGRLPREKAAAVLAHLEGHLEVTVVQHLPKNLLAGILELMDDDDAVDILGEMAEEEAVKVLRLMNRENREELEKLLRYDEDSAGGIMTGEFVALKASMTVEQTIEVLKGREDLEQINIIFVIDKENHLLGQIHVRDLLFKKPHTRLSEFIEENVVSVPVDMDQEEVAEIVARYDLLAVPVVDADHKLVGRVTVDDVIDVIHEEAEEDLYRMAGTSEEEMWTKSIFRVVGIRVPWLFVTLLGGTTAAYVIGNFEETLARFVAVSFFVPVVMGMSGNVGVQSATVVVRRLALGSVSFNQLPSLLLREFSTGIMIGVVTGVVLGAVVFVWFGSLGFGLILFLSLMAALGFSAGMGTFAPMVLDRAGVDPAIATSPFISTTSDVLAAFIYLSFASLLLNWI